MFGGGNRTWRERYAETRRGPQGPPGAAGSTWMVGTTAPNSDLGRVGDFYVNRLTGQIWGPKPSEGSWGTPFTWVSGGGGGGGTPGLSAYELAVQEGFVGTLEEWLDSLVGAPGSPGTPGAPGAPGSPGAAGPGVPTGGTAKQVLWKKTNTNFDTEWVNLPGLLPAGGTTGQVPVKNSNTDFDYSWATLSGGGGTATRVLRNPTLVDTAPSPQIPDASGPALAFSGDPQYNAFAVFQNVRTKAVTAPQPTTGYKYIPEITPFRIWLRNVGGHNEQTGGNVGRTGIPAMRVNLSVTSGTTPSVSNAEGDTIAYNMSAFINSAEKSGATHFLANAAVSGWNGDFLAGSNHCFFNTREAILDDGGYDISAIGDVVNMKRSNATGARGNTWIGYRVQSQGTQDVDAFASGVGKFKHGFDASTMTISGRAFLMAGNQRFALNATNSGSPYFFSRDTANGNVDFGYDTASASITFRIDGNVVLAVGANGQLDVQNFQTGTSYTVQASDNGKVLDFANASAVTVTLPNNLPAGFSCLWRQSGAGQITFNAASGGSRANRSAHTKSAGQWAEGSLSIRTNSGTNAAWILSGDTAA